MRGFVTLYANFRRLFLQYMTIIFIFLNIFDCMLRASGHFSLSLLRFAGMII